MCAFKVVWNLYFLNASNRGFLQNRTLLISSDNNPIDNFHSLSFSRRVSHDYLTIWGSFPRYVHWFPRLVLVKCNVEHCFDSSAWSQAIFFTLFVCNVRLIILVIIIAYILTATLQHLFIYLSNLSFFGIIIIDESFQLFFDFFSRRINYFQIVMWSWIIPEDWLQGNLFAWS